MTSISGDVVSVIVGPDDHGVVEHAVVVAEATGSNVHRLQTGLAVPGVAEASVAHLHYTDRLFGPDAESAAGAFCDLAGRLSGRVVVSLHDVPDPDGSAHSSRRSAAYRRVAERADLLIVASDTELDRLRRNGIDGDVSVVPLPITPVPSSRPPPQPNGMALVIGVLGFIYPGKGHSDVVDAAARAPRDATVWAIGRPSPGHDDIAADLERQAATTACHIIVTGYVDADELTDLLGRVDIPVVPARRPSASASLNRWIAAGRRPLVAANPYTCELACNAPGLVTLYDGNLGVAIAAAIDDPDSTWHSGEVPDRYTIDGVASAHRALYVQLGASP